MIVIILQQVIKQKPIKIFSTRMTYSCWTFHIPLDIMAAWASTRYHVWSLSTSWIAMDQIHSWPALSGPAWLVSCPRLCTLCISWHDLMTWTKCFYVSILGSRVLRCHGLPQVHLEGCPKQDLLSYSAHSSKVLGQIRKKLGPEPWKKGCSTGSRMQ